MGSSVRFPNTLHIVPVEDIPKSEDVKNVPLDQLAEIYKICTKMVDVCEAENGIGLSAVQVGLPFKLFIMKGSENSKLCQPEQYCFFLNCTYEPSCVPSDLDKEVVKATSIEGCLSIRSPEGRLRHFRVERYTNILLNGLRFFDTKLEIEEMKNVPIDGFEAIVLQHEIDHHFGVTINQIGQEVFLWK